MRNNANIRPGAWYALILTLAFFSLCELQNGNINGAAAFFFYAASMFSMSRLTRNQVNIENIMAPITLFAIAQSFKSGSSTIPNITATVP